MLLMMVERGLPIDDIIFCDTGKEFSELYDHINQVEEYIKRPITRLKPEYPFEYYLYQYKLIRGKRNGFCGYGWPSMRLRWCTKNLKIAPASKYIKQKYQGQEVTTYIGIAYDEPKRIRSVPNMCYPLYDWQITEAEALQYCYKKGFHFGGLYDKFKRLGCWCCPLSSIKELYALYKYFPDKWTQLLQMESDMYKNINWDDIKKVWPFNTRNKVSELDIRFRLEDERATKGLSSSMQNKEFKSELNRRIEEYEKNH